MKRDRYLCPVCKLPLGGHRYTLVDDSYCINKKCSEFRHPIKRSHRLIDFLDLQPYSLKQFLDLPEDTPIWLEYYWNLHPAICCASDILISRHDGVAEFAISEDLHLETYGKLWRAWPTFKSFRPDQYDLELHPW